jgi:single-strand DNA-binding protein
MFTKDKGILGRDPDLKYSAAGKPFLNFSIAIRRSIKDKNGKYPSDWFDVAVFGERAEDIAKHATKGSLVQIEGDLQIQTWSDPQGKVKRSPKIIAKEAYVLAKYRMDEKTNEVTPIERVTPTNPQTPAENNAGGFLDDYADLESTIGTDDFPFF